MRIVCVGGGRGGRGGRGEGENSWLIHSIYIV